MNPVVRSFLPRAAASLIAVWGFRVLNTAHEIVSPLMSGPAAAAQLTDSNDAYINSEITRRLFDGSGISVMVLVAVLALIWINPIIKAVKGEAQ